MAHVHYKFSSKLNYDTVVFDGLHITLRELKRQIMGREKLKAGDCDLQITNAQTKEEYTDDEALIAKNSSVIIRRIPVGGVRTSSSKTHTTERSDHHLHHHHAFGISKAMDEQSASRAVALLSKTGNLADADVSEEDKIRAMMSQSNHDYDPAYYIKKQGPPPPANYTCYRCGKNGHHIRNCPTNGDKNYEALPRIKKSTGIPRSFMVEVDDPSIKGAMLTNSGRYAIPTIDAEAYALGKKERPPFVPQQQPESEDEEEQAPDELLCLICKDLLSDAVVIPCCGNSYCDDCIRTALLESEEHVCPSCSQSDVSPDALIANKFLRQAVNNYKNEQGYTRNPKKAASASHSQTPTSAPSLAPTPPPPTTQPRSHRPLQPIRSQQDPLLTRPAPSDTPPSAQLAGAPAVATGPASAYSTPCSSPQPLQSHMETPSKEAEGKTPVDAAAATVPSGLFSTTDPTAAPSPLIPTVYHAPAAGRPQSNPQPSSSGLPVRHTGPPPDWESPSSPKGHVWTRSDTTSSSSSSSSATPATPVYPSPSLFAAHFPPYPAGHPPVTTYPPPPLWPPPVFPGTPILPLCSSSSSSIPALIPKELYRHHRRMKESPPSRVSGRARQRSKLDEMTNDFAKELLVYRKFQRERRRSYSRSPYRGSSYSRSSSRSYSKSHSSRSYSRSFSRSRSRSRGRSRSRSRSRSRPRSRSPYSSHRETPAHRSRSYGYRRSRSHSPSTSSSHRGGYRSRSRSRSLEENRNSHLRRKRPTPSDRNHQQRGDRRSSSGRSQRNVEGKSDSYSHARGGNQTSTTLTEKERYQQWEREYREWYERYFSSYAGHFHHLPPFLPTPPPPHREDRGTNNQPHSSRSDSRYRPQRRQDRTDSSSPPSQSSNDSASPRGEDTAQPMTYQQRCAEKYGRLPLTKRTARREPERPRRGEDHKQPIARDSEDLGARKHGKQKRMRKEERGGGRGAKSSSVSASDSTDDGHKEARSSSTKPNTSGDSTPLHDESTAGDELDSVPPPHEPDKPSCKDFEGKGKGEGGGEEGWRRERDPGSQQDRKREAQVKPSRDPGSTERDTDRYPGGTEAPDSRSETKRKRKEEERERKEKGRSHSNKMHRSKSVKTEFKPHKSESPKPFDREKQEREKKKAWGRQPLSKEIWKAGIILKPQKKISINISLDGKRKAKAHSEEFGELERAVEKEEEVKKTGEAEEVEESSGEKDIKENQRRESSREHEAAFEEKTNTDEGEGGEMRERASVEEDRGQTWEKNLGEEEVLGDKREDIEEDDFDLWQSALGGATDEEEEMKEPRGGGEKRWTGEEEEVTKQEPKGTRRGAEEEKVKDNKGQETREFVSKTQKEMEGEERRGKDSGGEAAEESKPKEEPMEGAKRRRLCEEEEEMARSQPQRSRNKSRHRLSDRPDTMVEFASSTSYVGSWGGVSSEERQERRTVVKTLEEYTQDRATPAADEIVLVQVPLSKWEKDEFDEDGHEEGEIKVQAGTPLVPVPPPSISMTTEIPTNRESEHETESKRQRETEREKERERDRNRETEREKTSTLSQPNRSVAPSSGKDRYDSTSPANRERERKREKERARDREREKERERARKREKEREREKERRRGALPSSSSSHSSSSSGSSSSRTSECEREKKARDRERRERDGGSERSSYSSSSRSSSSHPGSSSCRSDEARPPSGGRDQAAEFELPHQNTNKTQRDLKQKDHHDHHHHHRPHPHHHDPREHHRHSDRPADTHHPTRRSSPSPARSPGRERDPIPSELPRKPQEASEPTKPRPSSPSWDLTRARPSSLVPQPVEKDVAKGGATERDAPKIKVSSGNWDIEQNPWQQPWRPRGVTSIQHPASPTEPPRPVRDRARSSDTEKEKEGEREKRERNGDREKGGRLVSNPEREQDKAAYIPNYSESEEEEGKRGRDVVNKVMEEREGEGENQRVEAERDGNSRWADDAENWPRVRELEEGERASSPSSSVTSSASQEDGKKKEKEKKKHKKHKKHKKDKRQASLELEEGELKKHKHKKKKSKKGEESSGESDNRWEEEAAREDQTSRGTM